MSYKNSGGSLLKFSPVMKIASFLYLFLYLERRKIPDGIDRLAILTDFEMKHLDLGIT